MKTLGQLADRLAALFDNEQDTSRIKTELTKPMLPAKRAELQKELEGLSAARDALRAEELGATLHKP